MEFKRGRFFVIDGTDGSGKDTQTKALLKRLISVGYDSKSIEFPQYGRNLFADTIGASLDGKFGDATKLSPYLISIAYAADRWKAASFIESEISRGTILLSNRFTSASMGHQGSKIKNPKDRHEFLEWLRKLEFGREGFGIPQPDLTVLLYVNPEIARELIKKKEARTYTAGEGMDGLERNLGHQKRTAETFLGIARSEPSWRVIECMDESGKKILSTKEITEKMWEVVKPYLPPRLDKLSADI